MLIKYTEFELMNRLVYSAFYTAAIAAIIVIIFRIIGA